MVSVLEEAKRALVLINALAVVYAVRVNITRDSEYAKKYSSPTPPCPLVTQRIALGTFRTPTQPSFLGRGRYLNYAEHCTVLSVIKYLPKRIFEQFAFFSHTRDSRK